MGQQQLLLLVLSTVIVGLATVAGIQAFSENQEQATQDAITQRAVTIIQDLKGGMSKPAQLGGITGTDKKSALKRVGYTLVNSSAEVGIPGVSGNDTNANCELKTLAPGASSGNTAKVTCTAPEAPNDVAVSLKADGSISTNVNP
ncbi:hypothetical protein GGP66_003153 [Salinibacter ruber]|jgi:hypothetical protein|uniref:hypothetical protein n=1 Tax=Salinibacter ruber TaxID=146919 RepID=UPI0021696F4D|nr:hypothetical protein [Salinibacter ruber]MCS3675706.1 hypothetical protein [Salinibacter ruber]MCS4139622.1 hypothetical protein [Salinibacter ruber]